MRTKANDILTVQEVAALKQVDETSVRRAIIAESLKGFRKGKVYLVLRRDAEEWTPQRRGRKRIETTPPCMTGSEYLPTMPPSLSPGESPFSIGPVRVSGDDAAAAKKRKEATDGE